MLPIINTHQSWGAAVSFDASVLTLNIKDEPLKTVVKKISEVTGYQIFIDEEWGDLLVTASLKDVSLYESIRRILTNLNHTIILNDIEKKLSVTIYDRRVPAKNHKKVDSGSRQVVDYRDLEVIPPDKPGERGITQRELDAILASENKVDPLDVEVIPPQNIGERGVTQRELNAILASENKDDALDMEVIPPQSPGDRGITQRELDVILASENKDDALDMEVIPPQNPGERGVTQRELNTMRANDNRK
jgi:hypothetical protein